MGLGVSTFLLLFSLDKEVGGFGIRTLHVGLELELECWTIHSTIQSESETETGLNLHTWVKVICSQPQTIIQEQCLFLLLFEEDTYRESFKFLWESPYFPQLKFFFFYKRY